MRGAGILAFLVLGATVAAGCGLAFAPGDYRDEGAAAPPSREDGAVSTGVPLPTGSDASASDGGQSGVRLLLVAGRRPATPGESAPVYVTETLRTTLDLAGRPGRWSWDLAPPSAGAWSRALVAGGTLIVQRDTTVLRIGLGAALEGDWARVPVRDDPLDVARPWLFDGHLLAAGGARGTAPFLDWSDALEAAPLVDGGYEDWRPVTGSKLSRARGDVTLHRHGPFLYAIGGRDSTSSDRASRPEVEVGTIGDGGLPGQLVAMKPLVVPGRTEPHGVLQPVVATGAGYLFVIGGLTTGRSSSASDIVLAAPIDEGTGKLGDWLLLPSFPTPVTGAAAIVVGDNLLVFGGISASTISDAVMALPIAPGRRFGAWERVGSLPGPRTGLVGVTY